MNILAINASPRRKGNTSIMLAEFRRGAEEAGAVYEEVIADQLKLEYCNGCLRCNLIKRCSIKKDDWPNLSEKILNANSLVFGTPIYFHHVTAPLKKVLDRFRSFLHVQMTETGLIHTPWHRWEKHFVLVSSLGHQTAEDAQPVVDLMKFMINLLGPENQLTTIIGTGLGKANQVAMSQDQLQEFYQKIQMPEHLAGPHLQRNQQVLKSCYQLGKKLGASGGQKPF
ncbi:MAG: flavodoxin family protein [Candidatus Aminicenantes bacterium]|jgi:multimeric flavodoxin WrbA